MFRGSLVTRWLFAIALLGLAWWLRRPGLDFAVWNVDEAVTFTMAQQILAGEVPYRDAVDQRTPLAPFLQAGVFAFAGDWNLPTQHLALALLIGAAAIAIWLTARSAGDEATGVAAALWMTPLAFMLPSLRDTMTAHTGWYLMFCSCLGFWCLFLDWEKHRPLPTALAGSCFGLSFLAKQPGLLDFGVAIVLCLIGAWFEPSARRWRQAVWLAAGFAGPLAVSAAYFALNGAWSDFVYYAWTYNHALYVPEVSLRERLLSGHVPFALGWEYQPLVVLVGTIAGLELAARNLHALGKQTPNTFRRLEWLIAGWCAAGAYACTLSGRGFTHYAIQLLPGLALACGWWTVRLFRAMANVLRPRAARATGVLAAVALSWLLFAPALERRRHINLPVEGSAHVAKFVVAHTAPTDRIQVWGYNPEIYTHARRLPATRFLYCTFLTGLIPWTNLDPLKDTAYAIVPGAWDAFLADWQRHQPALLVDTRQLRGFLKYPLEQQPRLWPLLQSGYAEVELGTAPAAGYRLFKRLLPIPDHSVLAAENNSLTLTAPAIAGVGEVRCVVRTPVPARRIGLLLDGRLVRLLDCAPDRPAEAAFRLEPSLLSPGEHQVRCVADLGAGLVVGPTQGLVITPESIDTAPPGGPPLRLAGKEIRPLAARMAEDRPMPTHATNGRWNADAPSLLVYPLVPEMRTLTLRYGLSEAALEPPPDVGTDGIGLAVIMEDTDGRTQVVHRSSFGRQAAGSFHGLAVDFVSLPPHATGRLLIALTPGPENNPVYDWSFWRSVTVNEPLLQLGERGALRLQTGAGLPTPTVFNRHDVTLTGAPSSVEFAATPELTEISGVFGLLDAAWTADRSPPVRFTVTLRSPGMTDRLLFERELDPVRRDADRGVKGFRAKLPSLPDGTLLLATSTANGRETKHAFWGKLDASSLLASLLHTPTGAIALATGSTAEYGLGEIFEDDAPRLFAHVPTRLLYPVPSGQIRLRAEFGLLRSATAEGHTSDGATFVVEHAPVGGPSRELWRRRLDPFHQPEDNGPQKLDLPLLFETAGTLILRTEPSAPGQVNRAWSYWGCLTLSSP